MRMILFFAMLGSTAAVSAGEGIDYWNVQRKGANGDGVDASDDWFRTAAASGIQFVRLSVAEMKPSERDFLIGNADDWSEIPAADFDRLMAVLNRARKHNVRIVITMFSLPGCRWKEQNEDKFDYRLWHDEKYQKQSAAFWQSLADRLKDHPAVAGYNILNEPFPEREHGFEEASAAFQSWQASHRGTLADLNEFNRRIVKAIRDVDAKTPVVLDACFHANPQGMASVEPVDDPSVLYSFHFYEPWTFTTHRINKERFSYPDRMPRNWSGDLKAWGPETLPSHMRVVADWAARHKIPSSRILVGEFGCDRRVEGAAAYLSDTVSAINKHNWHWAFYSYRSSTWDGMDYELGTEKLGWKYWQGREAGQPHNSLVTRKTNPLWEVLTRNLRPSPKRN